MRRARPERRFDDGSAHRHFRSRHVLRRFAQHLVIDGVRSDGAERVGRELCDVRPIHAKLRAQRGDIDAVARSKIVDRALQFVFGFKSAQPPIDRFIGG